MKEALARGRWSDLIATLWRACTLIRTGFSQRPEGVCAYLSTGPLDIAGRAISSREN